MWFMAVFLIVRYLSITPQVLFHHSNIKKQCTEICHERTMNRLCHNSTNVIVVLAVDVYIHIKQANYHMKHNIPGKINERR